MDTDCNTRISAADAMKFDWLKTAHKEGRKLMLVADQTLLKRSFNIPFSSIHVGCALPHAILACFSCTGMVALARKLGGSGSWLLPHPSFPNKPEH